VGGLTQGSRSQGDTPDRAAKHRKRGGRKVRPECNCCGDDQVPEIGRVMWWSASAPAVGRDLDHALVHDGHVEQKGALAGLRYFDPDCRPRSAQQPADSCLDKGRSRSGVQQTHESGGRANWDRHRAWTLPSGRAKSRRILEFVQVPTRRREISPARPRFMIAEALRGVKDARWSTGERGDTFMTRHNQEADLATRGTVVEALRNRSRVARERRSGVC